MSTKSQQSSLVLLPHAHCIAYLAPSPLPLPPPPPSPSPPPPFTHTRLPGCAGITASMIRFNNKIETRARDFCYLSGSNLLFTMDTPTTPSRTADYHSELDFIWGQLYDEMRKPGNKVKDSSLRLFCSRDVFEL